MNNLCFKYRASIRIYDTNIVSIQDRLSYETFETLLLYEKVQGTSY